MHPFQKQPVESMLVWDSRAALTEGHSQGHSQWLTESIK